MSRKIVIEGFTYVIRARLGSGKNFANASSSSGVNEVQFTGMGEEQGNRPEGEHTPDFQKGETFQDNQAKASSSVAQK
jgi:hypothetical protein